jgi:hypothetical protein
MNASLPSYLNSEDVGPWGNYLSQVDRVAPHLGDFQHLLETLKRPRRILVVDVPIRLDNGTMAHFEVVPRATQHISRSWQGRRPVPSRRVSF